jgi:hypothetical protein
METSFVTDAAWAWAQQTFGHAALGDARRTARLVAMGAGALAHPAGRITQVYGTDAERQGAFGLLAHPALPRGALARAVSEGTARRAEGLPFVWVPLDPSSLTVRDPAGVKGTGRVGSAPFRARGFQTLSALAVTPDGVTLGLCGQLYWARTAPPHATDHHQRAFDTKETRHWEQAAAQVEATFATHAPGTRCWFQKDAGADSADLLVRDLRAGRLVTVRAVYDRRVHADVRRVRAFVAAQPALGHATLAVPRTPTHAARAATVALRACEVPLWLHDRLGRRDFVGTAWAVWVHELDAPADVTPLDWLLYTTYPVADLGDAWLVACGYATRWRVEEFHKTWKSGACHVEQSELRQAVRLVRWATILAAVAVRLIELRDRSRQEPDAPASVLLSADELEAVVVLRQPRDHTPGHPPTLGRVARWIAELGGYTGRASGGPPGLIVLERGWQKVQIAAETIRKLRENKM